MKLLILSDIHANQSAFQSVFDKVSRDPDIKACVLLGDLIDYGMHSNEVIQMAKNLPYKIICNIRGNHEDAIIRNAYDHFSSQRGKNSAQYTNSILNHTSWQYICNEMTDSGKQEFDYNGKKCLAVHGSLEDPFWKSIKPEKELQDYNQYDYVFSGHSHLPHFVEKYYSCEDIKRRNRKKTIFINPGSVGQPRNLNNMAQYALLEIEEEQVLFGKATYNIDLEQSAYHGQVDDFYRERLKWGV